MDLDKTTQLITNTTKECEKLHSVISEQIREIETRKKEIDTNHIMIKKDEFKCQEMYDTALVELKLTIRGLEDATEVNKL